MARLKYLWLKGAPIDPAHRVDHLDGVFEQKRKRLRLHFR
jgi:hypothetical protein